MERVTYLRRVQTSAGVPLRRPLTPLEGMRLRPGVRGISFALTTRRADVEEPTIDEARAALARLRTEKRNLTLAKRQLAAQRAAESARWRERQAGFLPESEVGDKSLTGNIIRGRHRGERIEHADIVAKMTGEQEPIDSRRRELVDQVLDLEATIRERGTALKTGAVPTPAPRRRERQG